MRVVRKDKQHKKKKNHFLSFSIQFSHFVNGERRRQNDGREINKSKLIKKNIITKVIFFFSTFPLNKLQTTMNTFNISFFSSLYLILTFDLNSIYFKN